MPATPRRAMLMNMFENVTLLLLIVRVHLSWATSMTLLVDLLVAMGSTGTFATMAMPRLQWMYPWFFSRMGIPCWRAYPIKLLQSHAEMHRDAPLRLVSGMSCEPPSHIEKLLQQLMLFAAVQPVALLRLRLLVEHWVHRNSLRNLRMEYVI